MKPWLGRVLSMAAAASCLAGSCLAGSFGGLADVSVIDRDTGVRLSPYYHDGEYWIAGRPGARYAIEIRNHLGERLLAVASVDGVNILSGANAAWDQEGYVFDAYEDYQITGWRKSDTEVAAFTFTASPNSYAERTGRPANVGVIGIALFRERGQRYFPGIRENPADRDRLEFYQRDQQRGPSFGFAAPPSPAAPSTGPAAPAPAAPTAQLPYSAGAGAPAAKTQTDAGAALAQAQPNPSRRALSEPKLGTGHGEREYSYVNHTVFARLQPEPNEVIRIRYDSLDNLIAMGIVRRTRPVPQTLDPFPASPERSYVPDPPG
jgi:hypothetical protein